MRLLPHKSDARIPFREAICSRAMVMDKDDAGNDQYLLFLSYDHHSMRGLTSRLAYVRHRGGEEEPTLLSRPVFVEPCGPEMTRWAYSAKLFGYPNGFVSIGPDWDVWIHESESECGIRLFRKKHLMGRLSTPDEVVGPVNLAVADLNGNGVPDLIGGSFCGYPDGYWPEGCEKTDNAPWSEIVKSRFDENGKWRGGQERGFLYRFENKGTAQEPHFEGDGVPILDQDGSPIEFFGVATACPVDFDGDGDTDLVCGQCDGNLIYLENVGSPGAPQFVDRGPVRRPDGSAWELLSRQSQPAAVSTDPAGRTLILLSGIHFGCVPFVGMHEDGVPMLGPEETFLTAGGDVHAKCFGVPVPVDWDGDGSNDLILGTSLGLMFFFRNRGRDSNGMPVLAEGVPLRQAGGLFETVWRQRPCMADIDHDGQTELIALDPLGRLAVYRKVDPADPARLDEGSLCLDPDGNPFKLDGYTNHGSVMAGRTKLWLADVTRSGTLDVLFGTILGKTEPVQKGRIPAIRWIENIGTPSEPRFGRISDVMFNGWPLARGRHTPAPSMADLNGDGELEMLIGIDCGVLMLFEASEIEFVRKPSA